MMEKHLFLKLQEVREEALFNGKYVQHIHVDAYGEERILDSFFLRL